MALVRGYLYTGVFFAVWLLMAIICLPVLLAPRRVAITALKLWATIEVWLLGIICGVRLEVRGRDRIPPGPLLVAAKHQSAFEIFALLAQFDDPAFVLKKELMDIPVFSFWTRRFRMIPIDRAAGARSMRAMVARAQAEIAAGRQIVIFPEGTRRPAGAPPDYKPGTEFLYEKLGVPCLPVALNSGLAWPGGSHVRYPGTIIIEFLDLIPVGIDRKVFARQVEAAIETATDRLIDEAAGSGQSPEIPAALERRRSRDATA